MIDNDVRVELKFKNARLYNAIRDAAFKDKDYLGSFDRGRVSAFCRFYDLPYVQVSDLLTLKRNPISGKTKTYRPLCVKLSGILGIECGELFPQTLYAQTWPRGVATDIPLVKFVALSAAKNLSLPASASDAVDQRELRELMAAAIKTLTPREEKVLIRRFGLDGEGERSLQEIGDEFCVGLQRIHQVEANAMRKLRHPRNSRQLRPFVGAAP